MISFGAFPPSSVRAGCGIAACLASACEGFAGTSARGVISAGVNDAMTEFAGWAVSGAGGGASCLRSAGTSPKSASHGGVGAERFSALETHFDFVVELAGVSALAKRSCVLAGAVACPALGGSGFTPGGAGSSGLAKRSGALAGTAACPALEGGSGSTAGGAGNSGFACAMAGISILGSGFDTGGSASPAATPRSWSGFAVSTVGVPSCAICRGSVAGAAGFSTVTVGLDCSAVGAGDSVGADILGAVASAALAFEAGAGSPDTVAGLSIVRMRSGVAAGFGEGSASATCAGFNAGGVSAVSDALRSGSSTGGGGTLH